MDQLEERIGKDDMCYSNLGSENKIIKDYKTCRKSWWTKKQTRYDYSMTCMQV